MWHIHIHTHTQDDDARAHAHTRLTQHTHPTQSLPDDEMDKHVHAHLCPAHTGPHKYTGPGMLKGEIEAPLIYTLCVNIHMHV